MEMSFEFMHFYIYSSKDASMIFVHVGLGFFVEFTFEEALKLISKKTSILTDECESLTSEVCEVKATIKIVIEVIIN